MIINGDSLEVLKTFEDNTVDAVVTDPPYGLSFMGKKWDYDVPSTELWVEVFRVLKPGGHLLAFAGTRTQHRMAVNIEDAGFEIRDMIAWVYGSGFPKSLNIGKAVDKIQGNEREVVGKQTNLASGSTLTMKGSGSWQDGSPDSIDITKGNSPWEGWGTALKPALEPITVARKPIKGTVTNNVLEHGVGGLNIDGCRVGIDKAKESDSRVGTNATWGGKREASKHTVSLPAIEGMQMYKDNGRFPANLIHDGSDEVVGLFPDTKSTARTGKPGGHTFGGSKMSEDVIGQWFGDSSSAARFFYCAKASKSERNKGLEGFEIIEVRGGGGRAEQGYDDSDEQQKLKEAARKYGAVKTAKQNIHPTVKPVKLMQYLVRLVTPKGGTVLDPFNGSGTTGIACKLEGMEYIGIELDPEYCKISEARIEAWEADKQEKLI